ncbi:MAG: polysaccharide deacetylase family protein [Anaerolineales bacterium]
MSRTTLPRKILRKIIHLAAPHVPLGLYRRLTSRNPVGFMYHAVSDGDLPHIRHLYPYKSTAAFEQDIRYLKEHYTLVGYPELLAHVNDEAALPPDAAFVSFDDGFVECYGVVHPILQKHGIPCIFFLVTDFIDNQRLYYRGKMSLCIDKISQLDAPTQRETLEEFTKTFNLPPADPQTFAVWLLPHQQTDEPLVDRVCETLGVDVSEFLRTRQPFLTREQIREMRSEGFVFGAHTRRHPKLAFLSQEEQAAEIIESCRVVAEITGDEQTPFAFPFSGGGVGREFLADLRARHPRVGLVFDTKKLRRDERFIFHRIWVDKTVPGVPPERNIEHWLHDAYVRNLRGMW